VLLLDFAVRVPPQIYDALVTGIVLLIGAGAQLLVFRMREQIARLERKLDRNTEITQRAATVVSATRTQLTTHDREMKERKNTEGCPDDNESPSDTAERLNS
jgi:hypothetical protein